MKNFFIVLYLIFVMGIAHAETCANGSGTIMEGNDGTRYCKSNIAMNWWSAFAWCRSVGGELIDSTEECNKYQGASTAPCPNLKLNKFSRAWTRNVANDTTAYIIYTDSGAFNSMGRSNNLDGCAFCIGNF